MAPHATTSLKASGLTRLARTAAAFSRSRTTEPIATTPSGTTKDDRVIGYGMGFGPTIRLADGENVITGELPPDATRVWTIAKRDCKLVQYRSALIRETLSDGPWDVLVKLYTADGTKPYDDLSISDIDFVNNEPGNRAVEC
jgi:hypothetical protein